ncbi:glycosyltransferase family 2 protein [Bacillus cereus group sp. MYBK30-1]|uniref:glycosyltransferase family 2 protein n=1 Tax=unclassified Bacillus cereus group TaxID=2750818 RepID=UPI003F7A0168
MIQDYELWLKYNVLTEHKKNQMTKKLEGLTDKPLFSIISTAENVDLQMLECCIESVKKQIYPRFELIITIPEKNKNLFQSLKPLASQDHRIKLYKIKEESDTLAKNVALQKASGDYITFIHMEDELAEDALYEMVSFINQCPDADMIYTDEDSISRNGTRHSPFFKPDWSPDTFLTYPYTSNLAVFRVTMIRRLKGFKDRYVGVEDKEIVLRLSEQTKEIYHIPKVLYHKRDHTEEKPIDRYLYAEAIKEALVRRKEAASVQPSSQSPSHFTIQYYPINTPLISIIIPTRDHIELLDKCLQSIFEKTSYNNYEIIIIDNGSTKQETLESLKKWQTLYLDKITVQRLDIAYNWSLLNNKAVQIANGELLLFLNNDTEILSSHWLEEMAGYALKEQAGAVGVKLLYKDTTIQHAGVILGVHGLCDHCYKGKPQDYPGYFGRLLGATNFSAVTGACLMVRKKLFEEIGGMEEGLSIEFNDVDFCLELLKRGYYNVLLPQVVLFHHESKTRGLEKNPIKKEISQREAEFLKKKWRSYIDKDPHYNVNLELIRGDFDITLKVGNPIEIKHFVKRYIKDKQIIGRMNARINAQCLELFGWAINQSNSAKKMEIIVVNQSQYVIAHAKINGNRKDIAEKYKSDSYLVSGWVANCDLSILSEGRHVLTGYAYFPEDQTAVKLMGNAEISI